MKKSNILKMFSILTLAAAGAFAVGAGLSSKKAEETKADGASGKVVLDMTDYWGKSDEACNVNIYFYDNSHNGWGTAASVAKGEYAAEVSYSFDWTPTKMIATRGSTSYSTGWSVYNRTPADGKGGHDFASSLRLTGWDDSATTDYAVVMGGKSGQAWSELVSLDSVKVNGSKHAEYFGSVTLTAGNAFKVVYGGNYYGYYSLGEGVSSSDFGGGEGSDIEVKTTGNYSLYFDAKTKNVHIANPDYAAADEWAQDFLGADCTASKSSWGTADSDFAALSSGAKALLAGEDHVDHETAVSGYIKQAVQRYDYVLQRFGVNNANTDELGYKDFMGRVSGGKLVLTPENFRIQNNNNNNTNSALIIITVVSLVSLSAVGGFFFIRKRKEN